MLSKISTSILGGAAVCAVAAMGFAAAPAVAQPYYGSPSYSDQAATVGGVTVTAPRRYERTFTGAPIQHVWASRVVPISDLDLSTAWGVHRLRHRVERAAASACSELDMQWTVGLYPLNSNDADCYHRAVDHAMAAAPITYTAYEGE